MPPMPPHTARVVWERGDQAFIDNRYSRRHTMTFDGGLEIAGSSSPHVVRVPFSDPAALDPEEAFVAALSSCHMLWFLGIAAEKQFRLDRYVDNAEGVMGENAEGKHFVATVTLRPETFFSGDRLPTTEQILSMHHQAHEACFIANSVLTTVHCRPLVD